MPAPSPSVTFINKLPLLAFLLPNVVAWGEEGGGEEKSKHEKIMMEGEVGKRAYRASSQSSCRVSMSLQLF